jgi:hypothetical protein
MLVKANPKVKQLVAHKTKKKPFEKPMIRLLQPQMDSLLQPLMLSQLYLLQPTMIKLLQA